MENNHVTEQLSDWQQILPPFPPVSPSEPSVFPPVHHEDLPVGNQEDEHRRLQEPETNTTPGGDGARRWMTPRLGDVQTVLGRFRNYVSCRVGFCQFALIVSGIAAGFLASFWRRRVVMWWQRRMQPGSSQESLMNLIREKDEKITQLLLQIAQMNEMLLARRRVPVIRVEMRNTGSSESIFETLHLSKPLIVVNEDLMDNHQSELAEELEERNHLFCARPQTLYETISAMDPKSLVPYQPGDATPIAKFINWFLGFTDE